MYFVDELVYENTPFYIAVSEGPIYSSSHYIPATLRIGAYRFNRIFKCILLSYPIWSEGLVGYETKRVSFDFVSNDQQKSHMYT